MMTESRNGTSAYVPACRSMALALLLVTAPLTACSKQTSSTSSGSNTASIRTDPRLNKLTLSADNRILWNGQIVTEQELADLLGTTTKLSPEPALHYQPDVDSGYEVSARVLRIIKDSKATKFGFVGNETLPEGDAPPK